MEKIDIVVVSLFDGLSGGRIALDRTPHLNVLRYYSSEVDLYAIQIASKNYPQDDEFRLGDVTKIDGVKLREKIKSQFPYAKIMLIGGSPCQGFSMAGKMKGSSTKCGKDVTSLEQYLVLKEMGFEFDGQSYLFWEYIRIKEELYPDYFMLENVRVTKKWKPMFNQALNVQGIYINSNTLSAQNRPRLYWTNIFFTSPKEKNIELQDILEDLPFRDLKPFVFGNFGDKKRIEGMKTIFDKKGNCCTTSKTHTNQYYLNKDKTKMRNLSCREYERLQTLPDDYTVGVKDSHRYKMIGNGWTIDVIAHIFSFIKE